MFSSSFFLRLILYLLQIDYSGKRSKGGRQGDENGDLRIEVGPAVNGNETEQSGQPVQPTDPPKQDYIHVRARRGQATDSHSLAERVSIFFASNFFPPTKT